MVLVGERGHTNYEGLPKTIVSKKSSAREYIIPKDSSNIVFVEESYGA